MKVFDWLWCSFCHQMTAIHVNSFWVSSPAGRFILVSPQSIKELTSLLITLTWGVICSFYQRQTLPVYFNKNLWNTVDESRSLSSPRASRYMDRCGHKHWRDSQLWDSGTGQIICWVTRGVHGASSLRGRSITWRREEKNERASSPVNRLRTFFNV